MAKWIIENFPGIDKQEEKNDLNYKRGKDDIFSDEAGEKRFSDPSNMFSRGNI